MKLGHATLRNFVILGRAENYVLDSAEILSRGDVRRCLQQQSFHSLHLKHSSATRHLQLGIRGIIYDVQ
jgi:hypothetical protein